MGDDSLITMIGYPLIFCAPWIVAVVWLLLRTPAGDGTPAPSLGERARSRLDLR